MIAGLILAGYGSIAAGGCIAFMVREVRRGRPLPAGLTPYERHRASYVESGDLAELEAMVGHVQ